MKKLTTCIFALLLTAGVAFGQNSATTSQTGDDNTATVNQTANNGGNDATITQNNNAGQGQEASISQVYETGGGVTANNEANITQSGSNNTSNGNNSVSLNQFGADNLYTVTQTGNGNQINDLSEQGDAPNGPSFSATIEMTQDGNNNIINDADQVGNGNTFIIDQLGNNNKADMEAQVNTGAVADGNYMKVTQNGNDNNAGFKAGLYQEGQNNSLTLTQNGGALFGNSNVSPDPNGTPPSTGSENFGGSSAVTQLGSDNIIMATQEAGSNVVESILQQGTGNTMTIDQGPGASTATLWQVGDGNSATVTQN